jgi:hypothetical protein
MHPRATRVVSSGLSVALHLLLFLWVYTWSLARPALPEQDLLPVRIIEPEPPRQARAPKPPPPAPPVQPPAPPPDPAPEAQPPPPEKKLPLPEQIVSPPDAGKNEAPPETRLLSDRDTRVEEQMVRKGQPKPGDETVPDAGDVKPQPKPAQAPRDRRGDGRKPPPKQIAKLPGLDRLMPDALQLAEEGYGRPVEPEAEQRPVARRQASSGGLWIPSSGPIGTLDYLPDVREGDITLLNTKAEVFAPFVRRVALRVFQNFIISLKRDLGVSTPPAIETVEAEAVMDPHGEMIRFTIKQRSARISLASDRRLQQACNDAFFDRNPPPGARAADGNFHFIMRTNVQVGPSQRGWSGYVEFMAGLL